MNHDVEARRRSIQRLSTELGIRIMTSSIVVRRIYRGTGRRRVPHPIRGQRGTQPHPGKCSALKAAMPCPVTFTKPLTMTHCVTSSGIKYTTTCAWTRTSSRIRSRRPRYSKSWITIFENSKISNRYFLLKRYRVDWKYAFSISSDE